MKLMNSVLSGLAAGLLLVGSVAVAQPPEGARPERGRPEGRPGFQPGAGPMFRPGQILPPMIVQRLELTVEQQEKLEALQSEVRAKLDAILTSEQKAQLQQMSERAPGAGRGGQAGQGGRGPRPDGAGPGAERRRGGDGERPGRGRGGNQPDA